MTEPPQDGGEGPVDETPQGPSSSDPGSPDYAGAPDGEPRRGAHRAGARPTPPPPPPAGAPYWPTPPDAPPGEKLKQPLADTLPLRLLQVGGALIGIILLVGLLYLFFHKDSSTEGNNTAAGRTTTAHTTAPTGTTTSGGATPTTSATGNGGTTSGTKTTAKPTTTTAEPTTKPPVTKPPTTKPPTTKPPTTKPPTTKPPTAKPTTAAPPPVDVKAPLLVLNNSRIHGLAVTGATTFRNGGWTVTGTGNYSGRLPQTTVFYSPGFQAAAETLARQFSTVTVVAPRPAGVPGTALTVVLTRYFHP